MNFSYIGRYLFVLVIMLLFVSPTFAQEVRRENPIAVECGTVLEGEFTNNYSEHNYSINLDPGTSINASVVPLGSGLRTSILLTGPTNIIVWFSDGYYTSGGVWLEAQNEANITTDQLGSRGVHTIRVSIFT